MAIKIVLPKNVNWGKVSYLPYPKRVTNKVEARKVAKKFSKDYRDILIVPEISYGMKRPYAYTIVGMGLRK